MGTKVQLPKSVCQYCSLVLSESSLVNEQPDEMKNSGILWMRDEVGKRGGLDNLTSETRGKSHKKPRKLDPTLVDCGHKFAEQNVRNVSINCSFTPPHRKTADLRAQWAYTFFVQKDGNPGFFFHIAMFTDTSCTHTVRTVHTKDALQKVTLGAALFE